jgi:hypothetical protein
MWIWQIQKKQAIWARQTTMLIVNSLIVNAARTDTWLNVAGLALCVIWLIMTCTGWKWFHKSLTDGKNVPVDSSLNPFAGLKITLRNDWIFISALLVILIFALIYLVRLWPITKTFICAKAG